MPIQTIETPRNAFAKRPKVLQVRAVASRGMHVAAPHGAKHFPAQPPRRHLSQVDVYLQRARFSPWIFAEFRRHDALSEVLPVLDPIQMNAKAGELLLLNLPFFEQTVKRVNHFLCGAGGGLSLQMVQLQNHVSQAARMPPPRSPRNVSAKPPPLALRAPPSLPLQFSLHSAKRNFQAA